MAKKIWSPLLPYITIGIGLLVLHNAWIAILGYHAGMIAIIFLAGKEINPQNIPAIGNYKIIIITTLLGAAGGLLLYLLWPVLAIPKDINLYLQDIGLGAAIWPYFIAYFILVNPWLEENYWRGYLGSNSRWIIPNDLLFSGYHILVLAGRINIFWLIAVFILLAAGAWFWRQANRMNNGISASLISHIAADTSVIITIYYMAIR